MKTFFLLLLCVSASAVELDAKFLNALNQVEASGRKTGVPAGDKGKAIGPFQIHYCYWLDSGVKGSYSQCTNYDYSVKVVTGYLNRYGRSAILAHDYETLARKHNGGPSGHKKESTKKYWTKVKKHL